MRVKDKHISMPKCGFDLIRTGLFELQICDLTNQSAYILVLIVP